MVHTVSEVDQRLFEGGRLGKTDLVRLKHGLLHFREAITDLRVIFSTSWSGCQITDHPGQCVET